LIVLVPAMYGVVTLKKVTGRRFVSKIPKRGRILPSWTNRRANDIWQVKHLNGFTLVSGPAVSARSIERSLPTTYGLEYVFLDARLE